MMFSNPEEIEKIALEYLRMSLKSKQEHIFTAKDIKEAMTKAYEAGYSYGYDYGYCARGDEGGD